MEWASNLISEIYKYLNYRDDTGIDRLNRLYTVALLSTFVTIISSQQYIVGGRILCWTPQDFTAAQNSYAHDICWLGHTNYYISENLTVLYDPSTPRDYPFLIYPWLPIILIGMTVSFAAPYLLIWQGLSTRSGIDIKRLMKLNLNNQQGGFNAQKSEKSKGNVDGDAPPDHPDNQEDLTSAIHFILFKKYSIKKPGGFYVISIYLLMKIFYIINLFCQIILINKLIIGDYLKINIEDILKILSVKYNMWSSAHFPIETMCDFMVRMLGENNNWFTVQCILPFNLFTKRIFALLTIWFIILLFLNLIDLIFIWLWQRLWLSFNRYNYILSLFDLYEAHLHNNNNSKRQITILAINDQRFCQEFVYNYLGIDGYLLIKFLHANSSDMNMSYLVVNLVDRFLKADAQQSKKISGHNDNTFL